MKKVTAKVKPTGYWTFFCAPAKWEVDKFLSTNKDEDEYSVTHWQKDWFSAGHLGIIRVGTDTRTKSQLGDKSRLKPGVYAIVEILGTPKIRGGSADSFWLEPPPDDEQALGVKIKYLKNLLGNPLLLEDLKDDPEVTDKYLLNGFQASSMPLDKSTFNRLTLLSGTASQIFANIETQPTNSLSEIKKLENLYGNATQRLKRE